MRKNKKRNTKLGSNHCGFLVQVMDDKLNGKKKGIPSTF